MKIEFLAHDDLNRTLYKIGDTICSLNNGWFDDEHITVESVEECDAAQQRVCSTHNDRWCW